MKTFNMDIQAEKATIEPEIVSYSEIYKWDVCHRQYYYRFGLGLMPEEGETEQMQIGTKGHKLLQSFYRGLSTGLTKEEALEATHQKAQKLLSEQQLDFGLMKAYTMVTNFINATDFNYDVVLAESRFLIPVSSLMDVTGMGLENVQIGFTPDVVFSHGGDFLTVEDSKFNVRAWSEKKIEHFQQAKLYQIFLKRMGYNVSRSSVRFFNMQTYKITHKSWPLTPAEEDTLVTDFVAAIQEVMAWRRQPNHVKQFTRRTTTYPNCGSCSFALPCGLEAKGKDASKTLHHLYKKSDYSYVN